MPSNIQVKICGVKTEAAIGAAVQGRASFIGFNFHPPSPRAISTQQVPSLRQLVPPGVQTVAVVVDATDAQLEEINTCARPDLFQLHGSESPQRAAEIHALTGRPLIKAFPVARAEDITAAYPYEDIVEYLLFDAKPSPGAALSGGSGQAFDWKILSGVKLQRPWFLAGGLKAENIKEAVAISGAQLLCVSSGVERIRGEKDPALIRTFLDTVRAL